MKIPVVTVAPIKEANAQRFPGGSFVCVADGELIDTDVETVGATSRVRT